MLQCAIDEEYNILLLLSKKRLSIHNSPKYRSSKRKRIYGQGHCWAQRSAKPYGGIVMPENSVTTPALIGICLGSTFFLISLAAVTCFCYKRRSTGSASQKLTSVLKKSHHPDKPLVLRKPTAVKSPSSGSVGGPVLMKKSPSPTQPKTSPPGGNSRTSPTGNGHRSPPNKEDKCAAGLSASNHSSRQSSPNVEDKNYIENVNEKLKNSIRKEDMEDNKEKEVLVEKLCKLGQLHFRLKYNADKLSLQVSIVKCTDLPPKDSNNGSSDPYVKLQLLPEKQHKVKTRVLRKTVDPVYDEDFTFYGINPNQLHATTLHFVVLSFDRYSRDDVIGEVICPLSGVDFKELEKQLEMTKEITPRNLKIRYQGRGELLVSLCYQPAANRLTVVVLKARNLPKMDFAGLCDPYVKIYLLYNNQRIAKKKTHVKKRTTNPVFNESFVFEVPYNEGLENISLEFLVLDWDRVTKNEVIGRLELGPKTGGPAQQHWNEVCNAPRRQIAEWHKLKE
ncbi:synaptotagmin-4 [Caerostris extrusa]|uniref:Synaptotagmin-4 n=1 Tax=Caerostris extrusa TaxID=172846 RepID=A0AAV4UR07_CAEEX|nr:synaptotagmin-4 [Caerostris extrusa]